ncbi:hypothetical protein IFM89_013826 [Coptis chinensis]|uniref:Uncharacterized protein n=1 Tax=Coptis chinensis TaxID=261450 RepID=A0A835HM68_9MAGN|nr:hypothetical protein IFM89_013826 [Coptis chinensis]
MMDKAGVLLGDSIMVLTVENGADSHKKIKRLKTCLALGYIEECDVLVKKRSKTIEQAAPISVDEVAGSTGCHPQSPPPVVTNVESTGDYGMDVGPVKKKKPDMDKQREIQAIKAGLPNKTCLCQRPGHSSLDVTPELLQLDYNITVEYRKYQRKYPWKKKTSKETNALPTQLGETLLTLNEYFMFSC